MQIHDLAHLQWFDYSGAPPLLLPFSLSMEWRGFYILLPDEEDEGDADLIIGDDHFLIHDEFDFEHPITHYDHLCSSLQTCMEAVILIDLPSGKALAINSEFDNVAYWPEKQVFICGCSHIQEAVFRNLDWDFCCDWELNEESVLLMNSCDHGAAPKEQKDPQAKLQIGKGLHKIDSAFYSDDEGQALLLKIR